MTKNQLNKILADHAAWLADNSKGKRANLSNANLSGADLSGALLTNADFRGADLTGAIVLDGWKLTNDQEPTPHNR